MSILHAKLSASGSHRWLNCPGSVKAEEGFSDKGSSFAFEGTCAHELADIVLSNGGYCSDWIGKQLIENNTFTVDHEMADYVQIYVDYVRSISGSHFYEQRVDFSQWVPEGFGTSDAIVIDNETLHVIDLKYGKGVRVDADNNTQGMLYALGALSDFGMLCDLKTIKISIVQPRLDHISEWELSIDDLYKFGEFASERAELALSGDGHREPGEKQCAFCKAKAVCPALKKFTENLILCEFDDVSLESPTALNNQQLRQIMDAKKLVIGWFDAVENHVLSIVESGEPFEGYKLVAGRSLRQWIDEKEVETFLSSELGEAAFSKKLLSVAQAEKVFGKKRATELETFICKPEGKPTLVPESDKRPAINVSTNDFDMLT